MADIKSFIRKIFLYSPIRLIEFGLSDLYSLLYLHPFKKSFSQKGEDLILERLLGTYKGLYVDIGANDPHRFSNTKRFYLKGWRGINIEPNPVNYKRFLKDRPEDININCGVGEKRGISSFYKIFPDTLSTFSKKMRDNFVSHGYVYEGESKVKLLRLSEILKKYAKGKKIAFFSIDTEGFDLPVLKSDNWIKYRPKIICIESNLTIKDPDGKDENTDEEKERYLGKQHYRKVISSSLNDFYIDTLK